MQRDDFATKISDFEIATKFSYPVAKLRLDFFVNLEPCLRKFRFLSFRGKFTLAHFVRVSFSHFHFYHAQTEMYGKSKGKLPTDPSYKSNLRLSNAFIC